MIFCLKINTKVFYTLIVFTGRSQASPKFAKQPVCEKEGRFDVDFLLADKHETFRQVDTINLGGHGQVCQNYTK